MPGSYERINYAIRPNKGIERKMIIDGLRRLREFGALSAYRYVGLGATSFVDFALFHKLYGITSLVSIERDVGNRSRFEFNKPFRCLEIEFGPTEDVLPTLDWSGRSIVWLDYDDQLDASKLDDIAIVCSELNPGSVFLISVNVHFTGNEEIRVEEFRKQLSPVLVPESVSSAADLGGWRGARVCWELINNRIRETVRERNGLYAPTAQLEYHQLYHFHYKDGARMLTVGGVIIDGGLKGHLAKCQFDEDPFYANGDGSYLIDAPVLTHREMRYLDSQLPCDDTGEIEAFGLKQSIVDEYEKIYKYYPAYVEAEF